MINTALTYETTGHNAAAARNSGDNATCRFHTEWFYRALRLETGDDKKQASNLFNNAYERCRQSGSTSTRHAVTMYTANKEA
jgi:hypothetical protein